MSFLFNMLLSLALISAQISSNLANLIVWMNDTAVNETIMLKTPADVPAAAPALFTFPDPVDCAAPGTFTNYVVDCGAETSSTSPSPWIQLAPAWSGSLRINTVYPTNWGENDFAFSDGTMNSTAQTLGFGQCVNISSVTDLAPGSEVTFGGYYRAKFDPARLTSVYVQMTGYSDTACTSEPNIIATSPSQSNFDKTWYSIYATGIIPANKGSIQVQIFHTYNADPGTPDSAFWDNFLLYPSTTQKKSYLPLLKVYNGALTP